MEDFWFWRDWIEQKGLVVRRWQFSIVAGSFRLLFHVGGGFALGATLPRWGNFAVLFGVIFMVGAILAARYPLQALSQLVRWRGLPTSNVPFCASLGSSRG